jgi:hypothetical protein
MKLHMTFPQLYGKYPEGNIYEMKRVNIFWYVFFVNKSIDKFFIDRFTDRTDKSFIDRLFISVSLSVRYTVNVDTD